jgi:hypothetical protein
MYSLKNLFLTFTLTVICFSLTQALQALTVRDIIHSLDESGLIKEHKSGSEIVPELREDKTQNAQICYLRSLSQGDSYECSIYTLFNINTILSAIRFQNLGSFQDLTNRAKYDDFKTETRAYGIVKCIGGIHGIDDSDILAIQKRLVPAIQRDILKETGEAFIFNFTDVLGIENTKPFTPENLTAIFKKINISTPALCALKMNCFCYEAILETPDFSRNSHLHAYALIIYKDTAGNLLFLIADSDKMLAGTHRPLLSTAYDQIIDGQGNHSVRNALQMLLEKLDGK